MECYMSVPNFPGRRLLEIYGSEGMLVAENTIYQLPTGNLWHYKRTSDGVVESEAGAIEYIPENMYLREIQLFSEAVEGGGGISDFRVKTDYMCSRWLMPSIVLPRNDVSIALDS